MGIKLLLSTIWKWWWWWPLHWCFRYYTSFGAIVTCGKWTWTQPSPSRRYQAWFSNGINDDEDSESETNTVKSEHISPLNLDSQFQQAESGEQAESGSSDVDDPELDEQVALPQWIVWTIVCCLCVCMRDTQPCAFHTSQLVLKGNQNQG